MNSRFKAASLLAWAALVWGAQALGRPLAPGSEDASEPAPQAPPAPLTTNDYGTNLLVFDIPALALLGTWSVVLHDKYKGDHVGWIRHHDDTWISTVGALAWGTYLIPGPVIHSQNNGRRRGIESFVSRLGGAFGGAIVGLAGATIFYEIPRMYASNPYGAEVVYWSTAAGGILGATTAILVDDYVFEKNRPRRQPPTEGSLRPSFILNPYGAHLTVRGTF